MSRISLSKLAVNITLQLQILDDLIVENTLPPVTSRLRNQLHPLREQLEAYIEANERMAVDYAKLKTAHVKLEETHSALKQSHANLERSHLEKKLHVRTKLPPPTYQPEE